jgi:PAS domain S-box-containing protein
MTCRQQRVMPPSHNYASEIDRLHCRLSTLTLRWQGVAPAPPSVAEAIEELATTVEELHAMNDELTQSQQAALETQQRYQELFEGVPEAYLVTDLQGVIQEANGRAAHLLNLDRPQLLGLPLAVFMAQDMRPSFWSQLAWLRQGAEVREWVIRVQPRHQPAVPAVCQAALARDAQGAPIGVRWLLHNLTAQHQAQEALAQRVRELTKQLADAHDALQATQDQAELRGREIHHRMKNNLQVVASLLDWRGQDLQDRRARTIFQECQGRIGAIALVHELLYRAGGLERIDLGHYLRQLTLQLFQVYGIDRERIPLTLQADVVEVGVNTAIPCGLLLHEVLANCIQHAFPAQPRGAVMVRLQTEPMGQVTLTIRDTGVGLPKDPDVHDAGGFGLHLVRALTEQLQGTITFGREGGTCVILTFPI